MGWHGNRMRGNACVCARWVFLNSMPGRFYILCHAVSLPHLSTFACSLGLGSDSGDGNVGVTKVGGGHT